MSCCFLGTWILGPWNFFVIWPLAFGISQTLPEHKLHRPIWQLHRERAGGDVQMQGPVDGAAEFAPEGGASRQAWEAQRRARVARPKEISVTISDVQVTPLAAGRVQVTFQQDYQSDMHTNRSTKVLEMAQSKCQWQIRREYTR